MVVLRFVALILIVVGLMLLGADVVTMLESGGEPRMRSLETVFGLFTGGAVEGFRAWAGSLPSPLSEGTLTLLSWPAFAVLGVVGVVLAILVRQRDRDLES